ncbi:Macrolide export protein MacA [Dickeya dianthicola]|uniref:efflux RND transporter periplasmic adaptor subunit n=1 Tax=Dickeya dianthicola TaxID=204039 RepID=UPI000CD3C15A|nr:efflux RND transporter periplasmic adaptor subunit [Dickeya dianthicola]AYC17747.1 Macrolide export protein MacA [Dickeya dianthicola]MBI0436563.1 efflux RND transporter periplasmic adaptor subunit [Dickeya dianthicola]MBI0449383.1 efflux RND transporter periplasmic adaptor subunit [Dickeya dianthicola]MBI0454055.1 efflux RND transporter periplasmic adaptor subunit [Dickeya dianthicola]MBI0458235.1 efflux RND transporter periplasmic adaptor subunit [Dickeya dianthicola]
MRFRPRSSRFWWLLAGLAAITLFVVFRLSRPAPVPNYITATVDVRSLQQTVLADGTVNARKLVSVGAQVSGQIRALNVSLGDKVKQGQLLAEIDDLTQQNTLRDSKAALDDIQAQRASRQATLRNNQLNWQRQHNLMQKGLGVQADYDSAKATLDAAQADIHALDAQIVRANIAVNTAQVNLAYTKIVSPIAGTVVALPVEQGQTVNAVQSTPTIAKVATLDTMTIEAKISEADVINVRTGMPVWFTILGAPNKRYQAVLRAIEPAPESLSNESAATSNSTTGSSASSSSSRSAIYYNGLFDVDNPDETLRISMTAQVYILLSEAKRAIVAPVSALINRQGKLFVQVTQPQGRPELREVTTGISDNAYIQLLSGVQPGEEVVISQQEASDGSGASSPPPPPMGF